MTGPDECDCDCSPCVCYGEPGNERREEPLYGYDEDGDDDDE
jgi:hypothetical protein